MNHPCTFIGWYIIKPEKVKIIKINIKILFLKVNDDYEFWVIRSICLKLDSGCHPMMMPTKKQEVSMKYCSSF